MPKSSETRTLLFSSCKGGVGKSTVCANLAMAMAAMGQKILLIDCDFGNRCLDIIMGLSDDAVYDIGDAVLGRVSPDVRVDTARWRGRGFALKTLRFKDVGSAHAPR